MGIALEKKKLSARDIDKDLHTRGEFEFLRVNFFTFALVDIFL